MRSRVKSLHLSVYIHIGVDCCKLPSECAAVVLELKNRPSPKSPSFTTPVAVMNTLAGLISRKEEDRRREEVTS